MTKAIIRDNYMNFGGIKYFRSNADEIELGSYGEKRTPLFGANYLEVYKNLPFNKLKVDDAQIVEIDFTRSSESDFTIKGGLKIAGADVSLSGTQTYNQLRSGELALMKLSVKRGDMVDAINASPRARDKIDDLGNDVRVCHQVFVVMEANLARSFSSSTNFDVSGEKGDIHIEVSGGHSRSGSTEVTLHEGTVFAYLMLQLEWDKKSKRKRTKVVNAKDDQWSFG